MSNMSKLESLRLRAIALRSSIHNEHQLSAIELTGMCAKKTNEIIDVVNEVCVIVDNIIKNNGLTVKYDEITESLNIGGIEE